MLANSASTQWQLQWEHSDLILSLFFWPCTNILGDIMYSMLMLLLTAQFQQREYQHNGAVTFLMWSESSHIQLSTSSVIIKLSFSLVYSGIDSGHYEPVNSGSRDLLVEQRISFNVWSRDFELPVYNLIYRSGAWKVVANVRDGVKLWRRSVNLVSTYMMQYLWSCV